MNNEVTTMAYSKTAVNLSEYLLVAMPDQALVDSLRGFQQNLITELYPGAGLLPVRYLTLARLMAKDYLEETVSRWIMKVCRIKPSFSLSFEKTQQLEEGVLSLQVADSAELRSFYLQLDVVADFLSASECLRCI